MALILKIRNTAAGQSRGRAARGQQREQSFLAGTAWITGGQVARLAIQAAYFVLMARSLGAREYGGFVAISAMFQMVAPFVGLGTGHLMIQHVSRRREEFAAWWGNCLATTAITSLILIAVLLPVSRFLVSDAASWHAVLLIGLAELVFTKLVDCAGWAFQAGRQFHCMAAIQALVSLNRLVGIVVVSRMAAHPTIERWAVAYLMSSLVAGVIGVIWASVKMGAPRGSLRQVCKEMRQGLYFSVSLASQTVYNDIDKTMLGRFSTLTATGIYAAAYRLIDVAFVPVRSMLASAYSGYFREGQKGIWASALYGLTHMKRALLVSLALGMGLLLTAQFVPMVLGRDFARTAEALRWLALLPFLKSVHYFVADMLTGAGYQFWRTVMQLSVAVFNVLINLWLIPEYGWRGAAWSSLASDGMLAVLVTTCVIVFVRREETMPRAMVQQVAA